MIMRIVERDTVSTLLQSVVPFLGVSCRRCRHRALLSAVQLEAHENDRRQRVLLDTPDEPQAFLAGNNPVEVKRQGDGLWSPSF
jgi:hypothetical protein